MRRKEAEEQAQEYARNMIASLNKNNEELRDHQARINPAALEITFRALYMRHIQEHYLLVP
jgi:hypothetical protein